MFDTKCLMLTKMPSSHTNGLSVDSGVASLERIKGSSEMADLIRSKDWSRTSLGGIETWSEVLVSVVNIMLHTPLSFALYWGEDMTLLYNDVYRAFLGEKHPRALGQHGPDVWHEAWETLGPAVRAAFQQGIITSSAEAYIPIQIGGTLQDRWWTYAFYPIYEQGLIAGVANPGTDDTPRVLSLREREAISGRLSQVLGATRDAIVTVGRDWSMTYLNPGAEKLYGSSAELVGRNVWEAFPDAVYDGSPFTEAFYKAMNEGVATHFEAYYPEPLNATLSLEVYSTPDGIVTFSRDVTEFKKTTAALLQNEKLAAVGRLASSISHEINNPLEAVTNLLFLTRNSTDVEQMHQYIDTAERELKRVSIITNQTLRFYKQSTKPAPIYCYDMIGDSLSVFQGRLVNSKIVVEKLKRAEHPVNCFGGEIRQVLSNLIANAIDAMPLGGRLLLRSREATDSKTEKRGLVITVADTGVGISKAAQKKIFDAFFTTKGIGGTGLGLWISCEIVARHKGWLRVRSSEEEGRSGTVFALFLPFDTFSGEGVKP